MSPSHHTRHVTLMGSRDASLRIGPIVSTPLLKPFRRWLSTVPSLSFARLRRTTGGGLWWSPHFVGTLLLGAMLVCFERDSRMPIAACSS
jgi:hypothetical protein